ncbi:hypothetical protein [uncultured Methanolobus sp.]|nr:hypothetical protein [uncultured Methanolobus sp.]
MQTSVIREPDDATVEIYMLNEKMTPDVSDYYPIYAEFVIDEDADN